MTRRRRRTALLLAIGVVFAVLLLAAWSGLQVYRGAHSLQAAADRLDGLSTELTDDTDLVGGLRAASQDTRAARQRFEDPFVRLGQELPFVGTPLRAASVISISADTAVREAALPLAEAAGAHPTDRLIGDGGSIDLPYLTSLAGPASVAGATLVSAQSALADAPRDSGFGRLDDARVKLTDKIAELQETVHALAVTTDIGPGLLGRAGPKTYFLGVQNPAEARGTGGLIGGYVILEADNGIIRVTGSGANTALQAFRQGTQDVADLGAEYDQHWGPFSPDIAFVNSNVSPHFPYAAQIWAALWQQQSGQKVDGVLALDPVALSYLLKATGPVRLSNGTAATAGNVVDLTLRDAYARFDDANAERKEYLQEVTRGVAQAITGGKLDAGSLLRGLSRAAQERRVLIWTPDARVQEVLGDAPLTGRLPSDPRSVGDVINNAAGSKLDYYLDRQLTYRPACTSGPSTLVLRLTNRAPASGLPRYVSVPELRQGQPANTSISVVTMYVPHGSRVTGYTVDGSQVASRGGDELGLPWASSVVSVRPGQSKEVAVTFDEPDGAGEPHARVAQPLVRPETYVVDRCR